MVENTTLERLARIEAKLNVFIEIQKDHDDTIESLKSKVYWIYGAGSVLMFCVTFFGDFVRNIFTK